MELTCREVGSTRDLASTPADARHLRVCERIGDATLFGTAADFVLTYGMQRSAGHAQRRGFAYGTLASHAWCSEELFLVERGDGGTWVEVWAFSRPG